MKLSEQIKIFFGLRHKFLVLNILSRNLKLKYRRSFLGFLWTILIPAANAVIYYFVFKTIMRIQIPNHLLFLLSGLLPWGFFSTALTRGLESIYENSSLLNKVPIPSHIFTYTETTTFFINYLISLPVLVIVQVLTVGLNLTSLAYLLVFSAMLFIQAYALGLLLAYAYVLFRDLKHLFAILIQIWFYLTPIVYPADMIPQDFHFITYLNPVGSIFEGIHATFVFDKMISFETVWFPALAWTSVVGLLGFISFQKYNKKIVEYL